MKALVIVLALTASAYAEPMSADARAHFDRGRALYDAGSYAEAIAELTAGRELAAHPDFDYALGQAYRKLGDCAHAVAHYRAFLATQPPEGEAERVEANLARCPRLPTPAPATPTPAPAPAPTPRVDSPQRPRFYRDVVGGALAAGAVVRYVMAARRDPAVSIAVTHDSIAVVWSGRL